MEPSEAGKRSLRIMTYNIRHGKGMDGIVDLDRTAKVLFEADAELIALQEVDRFQPRSGCLDQPAVLAEKMKMRWCFSPSLQQGNRQYGNAILSRLPLLRASMYHLSGKERRSILRAVTDIHGREVHVFNTHLGVSAHERKTQMEQLAGLLLRVHGAALLMGDFNMDASDPLVSPLFRQGWHKLGGPHIKGTLIGGPEIDHIWVRGIAAAQAKVWTLPADASDHYPVVAQIEWEESSVLQ